MFELKVYAVLGPTLGLGTFAALIQTLVTPDDTWLPVGGVLVMIGAVVGITYRVTRLLTRMEDTHREAHAAREEVSRLKRMVDRVYNALGLDHDDKEGDA